MSNILWCPGFEINCIPNNSLKIDVYSTNYYSVSYLQKKIPNIFLQKYLHFRFYVPHNIPCGGHKQATAKCLSEPSQLATLKPLSLSTLLAVVTCAPLLLERSVWTTKIWYEQPTRYFLQTLLYLLHLIFQVGIVDICLVWFRSILNKSYPTLFNRYFLAYWNCLIFQVHPSHGTAYISFGGQEIPYKNYQVLCKVVGWHKRRYYKKLHLVIPAKML